MIPGAQLQGRSLSRSTQRIGRLIRSNAETRRTAEDAELDENEIGKRVIGCALTVHRALGPGLLENVCEACLAHELGKAGLDFDSFRCRSLTTGW